jgi:hypothetical protein
VTCDSDVLSGYRSLTENTAAVFRLSPATVFACRCGARAEFKLLFWTSSCRLDARVPHWYSSLQRSRSRVSEAGRRKTGLTFFTMCDIFPEVCVSSFAFKTGTPDVNVVLDVRFLPDPRLLEETNPDLTGKHRAVEDFIRANSCFDRFFAILTERLTGVLQDMRNRGHCKVGVAFGCTAGRHRSVFVAEHLARWLREQMNLQKVFVRHRDMGCDSLIRSDAPLVLCGDFNATPDSGEIPDAFCATCGPRIQCTYHPDTLTLETFECPGLQCPESAREQVSVVLGSGLSRLRVLREKRARECDNGPDYQSSSCNDLHGGSIKWRQQTPQSQTI